MKRIMFFLILLVLASNVYGVKPVTNVFIPTDQGIVIHYPFISDIELDQSVSLHFHLFNISSGLPLTDQKEDCYFHLYNSTGSHIYTYHTNYLLTEQFDYEVKLDGNNFSKVGHYSYIFQCNSTRYGGAVTVDLSVVDPNNKYTFDVSSTGLILGLVFAAMLLLFMGRLFSKEEENSWVYFLNFPCYYLALLIPLYGLRILSKGNGISEAVRGLLNQFFIIYLVFYVFLVLMLVVYIIHLFFTWMIHQKVPKHKRLRDDFQ